MKGGLWSGEASGRWSLCRTPWPKTTIAAGYRHTVALLSHGAVVAVGENRYGQCDVAHWRDIEAVAVGCAHTGNFHTVGLRSDGTVVAAGWNKYGQCEVDEWRDVVTVAVGWRRTVAVKADGTVVAVGDNRHGQCEVGMWRGVRLPGSF